MCCPSRLWLGESLPVLKTQRDAYLAWFSLSGDLNVAFPISVLPRDSKELPQALMSFLNVYSCLAWVYCLLYSSCTVILQRLIFTSTNVTLPLKESNSATTWICCLQCEALALLLFCWCVTCLWIGPRLCLLCGSYPLLSYNHLKHRLFKMTVCCFAYKSAMSNSSLAQGHKKIRLDQLAFCQSSISRNTELCLRTSCHQHTHVAAVPVPGLFCTAGRLLFLSVH